MSKRLSVSLLALLLGVSAIVSILTPFVASAASDYHIGIANSLRYGGDSQNGNCPQSDVSTNWSDFLSPLDANPLSYKNTWNYQADYQGAREKLDNIAVEYSQRLPEGSGWGIIQSDGSAMGVGEGNKTITIFVFDGSWDVTITDGMINFPSSVRYATFFQNPNTSCRFQVEVAQSFNFNVYSEGMNRIFLLASDNISYPSDYSGPQIPSTFSPNVNQYPDIDYVVENKKVTLLYKNNITGGCSINWMWREQTENDPQPEPSDIVSKPSTEQFSVEVPSYGKYIFLADLKYLPPPYACAEFPDGTTVLPTILTLTIDGSDYSGSTGSMDCENGSDFAGCLPPSPFEDCSTYGADLVGGFGCIMRNFIEGFKITMISLFVPSSSFMMSYFNDFKDFITQKLGFLVWPLTFASDFVSAFFNGLNGTNNICAWSFGSLFGSDFKLNFCSLQQNFPSAFDAVRYMIQAFTVFSLISGLYAHYRGLIKT